MSAVTDLIGNATSSGYTAPQQQNVYQPSGTSQLDKTFQGAINQSQNNNPYLANAPYYQQVLQQQLNNPYAGQMQTNANQVGANAVQGSNALSGGANQLLQSYMNPQSQMYNQQQQMNTDQTNASLAARGLNSSGYGAQLADQSNQQFNMNWMNNLQNQQQSALGAAGGALGQAGQIGAAGAQLPYDTANQVTGNQSAALANYGNQTGNQANALTSANLGPMLNYLSLGASQSNQQADLNNSYWRNQTAYISNQNNQNQQMWGDIGNGLFGTAGTPAGLFGGGSNATSGLLGSGGNLGSLASFAALF